jgi:hypothetical protein
MFHDIGRHSHHPKKVGVNWQNLNFQKMILNNLNEFHSQSQVDFHVYLRFAEWTGVNHLLRLEPRRL